MSKPNDSLASAFNYRWVAQPSALAGRDLDFLNESSFVWDLIERLVAAIDAIGRSDAQSHVRRVVVYATGFARAAGLPENEVQAVRLVALLHDIGKIAIPEHILVKPGALTQDEFQKIRTHPQIGADILSGVSFPYPVAPLILAHHERWDGKGYPLGLKGEEIPLGARILTIVDYYEALTTERPDHKALPCTTAVERLMDEAGRAFDPTLVDVFVERMPDVVVEALESARFDATSPASLAFGEIASSRGEIS